MAFDPEPYFTERTEIGEPDECWHWKLSVGSHGYGQGFDGQTVILAHRLSYELFNGSIPDDLVVDHTCHNRRCVNPGHLRLLTRAENARLNSQFLRTICPQGHPYDEANTYRTNRGHRRCRLCAYEFNKAARLRKKDALCR